MQNAKRQIQQRFGPTDLTITGHNSFMTNKKLSFMELHFACLWLKVK